MRWPCWGLTGCEHPTANQAVSCFCRQAHLAALEKTSAETEKLIDEAKTEKLRHMEELYQSNRRVTELEAKYAPVSFFFFFLFVWLFVSFGHAVTWEDEWGSQQGLRKQLLTYCFLMVTVLVECCVHVQTLALGAVLSKGRGKLDWRQGDNGKNQKQEGEGWRGTEAVLQRSTSCRSPNGGLQLQKWLLSVFVQHWYL